MAEPSAGNSDEFDNSSRAKLVRSMYVAVLRRSRDERAAFDAAVQCYRGGDSTLSERDVREAVANIICLTD